MVYFCRWHDSCTHPSYDYVLEQCDMQDTVVAVDSEP